MTREADNPMTEGDFNWIISNHAVWGWKAPVKASVSAVSLLQLSPFFASTFPLFLQKRLILRLCSGSLDSCFALWGSLTWHGRRSNERGLARLAKTFYYRGECKHFFRRQLHRKQMVAVGWELQKQFSHGMRMEMGSEKLSYVPKYNLKKYKLTALKHTYQLRGMASTLRMRTTMSPNKGETAVHGCHCRGDMVVPMRKVLAIPWSWYVCFKAVDWFCF